MGRYRCIDFAEGLEADPEIDVGLGIARCLGHRLPIPLAGLAKLAGLFEAITLPDQAVSRVGSEHAADSNGQAK